LSDQVSDQEKTKNLILEIIEKQKPESLQRLVSIVQKTDDHSESEIISLLLELNSQKRIELSELRFKKDLKNFVFSIECNWYWGILAMAIVATIFVLVIPQDLFYMWFVRNLLGLVLVLFLPGYAMLKVLFPRGFNPQKNINLGIIESLTLSISFSLGLSAIVGLVLYYTTIGLNLIYVTIGLFALTVVIATVAVILDYRLLQSYYRRSRKTAEYFKA
jgi:uncharacterized membrane protein